MIHPGLLLCSLSLFICLTLPEKACSTVPTQPTTGLIGRYQAALAADPDNLTLHYLLAVTLLDNGQDRAAMDEFRRAYPAYRSSLEANYNLAVTSLRLADLESAQIYLDQAEMLGAAEQPRIYPLANLYFNMAVLTQDRGQSNETIRYYQKVLELAPDRHEIYRQLGDLHAQRGETELAVQAFHHYLKMVPDDPVSRDYLFALEFNTAQDYLEANDLESSARHFSAALAIHPESPAALYYLGYIAYTRKAPGEAIILLLQAHELGDSSLRASIRPLLYNCCLELRQSGQEEQALQAASLLADNPSADFKELFMAGTLSLEQGQYRKASSYLLRASKINPRNAAALQNLIASESGAFNEWLSLSRQQLTHGDFIAASTSLEAAEELQPDNRQITALRKQILLKQQQQATEHFRVAAKALNDGAFNTASDQVNRGLELTPQDPEGLVLRDRIAKAFVTELDNQRQLVTSSLAEEQWRDAEQALMVILSLTPDDQQAANDLQRVEQGKQQSIQKLLSSGQAALDQGEPEQAHDIFQRALEASPGLPAAVNGLSTSRELLANRVAEYLRNGRNSLGRDQFDDARNWFTRAFQIDAGDASRTALQDLDEIIQTRSLALLKDANQLVSNGDFKRADALYSKVLQVDPGNSEAEAARLKLSSLIEAAITQHLIDADRALGKQEFTKAMADYRKALALAPDNAEAQAGITEVRSAQAGTIKQLTRQIEAELDQGELQSAEQTLSRALILAPYDSGVRQQQERLERLRLSGAQPGDEQKLYLQGVALYTQGQYDEAIKAWETVLTLTPGHVKARQNIDKTRRKMRQLEEYRSG